MGFLDKLFGKSKPKNQHSQPNIASGLDQGGPKIMISMHMFVKMMKQYDSRWEDLFHFSGKDDYAEVLCLKGFKDLNTTIIMPQLWQRKSFIENCKLFGCNEIRFKDAITGESRIIQVADVDENKLP